MASSREAVLAKERELKVFWQVNARFLALSRANPLDPERAFVREEIETMAEMTDWPRLREACLRSLRLDDLNRQPALRAGIA